MDHQGAGGMQPYQSGMPVYIGQPAMYPAPHPQPVFTRPYPQYPQYQYQQPATPHGPDFNHHPPPSFHQGQPMYYYGPPSQSYHTSPDQYAYQPAPPPKSDSPGVGVPYTWANPITPPSPVILASGSPSPVRSFPLPARLKLLSSFCESHPPGSGGDTNPVTSPSPQWQSSAFFQPPKHTPEPHSSPTASASTYTVSFSNVQSAVSHLGSASSGPDTSLTVVSGKAPTPSYNFKKAASQHGITITFSDSAKKPTISMPPSTSDSTVPSVLIPTSSSALSSAPSSNFKTINNLQEIAVTSQSESTATSESIVFSSSSTLIPTPSYNFRKAASQHGIKIEVPVSSVVTTVQCDQGAICSTAVSEGFQKLNSVCVRDYSDCTHPNKFLKTEEILVKADIKEKSSSHNCLLDCEEEALDEDPLQVRSRDENEHGEANVEQFFDDSVDIIEEHEFLTESVRSSPFRNDSFTESDSESEDKSDTEPGSEGDSDADSESEEPEKSHDVKEENADIDNEAVMKIYYDRKKDVVESVEKVSGYLKETEVDMDKLAHYLVQEAVARGVMKCIEVVHTGLIKAGEDSQFKNESVHDTVVTDCLNQVITDIEHVEASSDKDAADILHQKLYSWSCRLQPNPENVENGEDVPEKREDKSEKSEPDEGKNDSIPNMDQITSGEMSEDLAVEAKDLAKLQFKQRASQNGITISSPQKAGMDCGKSEDSETSNRSRRHSWTAERRSIGRKLTEDMDSDVQSLDSSFGDPAEAFKRKASQRGIRIQDPRDSIESDSDLELVAAHRRRSESGNPDPVRQETSTPDSQTGSLNPASPVFVPYWKKRIEGSKMNVNAKEFSPDRWNTSATGSDISDKMNAEAPEFIPEIISGKSMIVKAGVSVNESAGKPSLKLEKDLNNSCKGLRTHLPSSLGKTSCTSVAVQASPTLIESCVGTRRVKTTEVSIETKSCDSREVSVNTSETLFNEASDYFVARPEVTCVNKSTNTSPRSQRTVGINVNAKAVRKLDKGVGTEFTFSQFVLDEESVSPRKAAMSETVKNLQVLVMHYKEKEAVATLRQRLSDVEKQVADFVSSYPEGEEKMVLLHILRKRQNALQEQMQNVVMTCRATISQIQAGLLTSDLPDLMAMSDSPSAASLIPGVQTRSPCIHSNAAVNSNPDNSVPKTGTHIYKTKVTKKQGETGLPVQKKSPGNLLDSVNELRTLRSEQSLQETRDCVNQAKYWSPKSHSMMDIEDSDDDEISEGPENVQPGNSASQDQKAFSEENSVQPVAEGINFSIDMEKIISEKMSAEYGHIDNDGHSLDREAKDGDNLDEGAALEEDRVNEVDAVEESGDKERVPVEEAGDSVNVSTEEESDTEDVPPEEESDTEDVPPDEAGDTEDVPLEEAGAINCFEKDIAVNGAEGGTGSIKEESVAQNSTDRVESAEDGAKADENVDDVRDTGVKMDNLDEFEAEGAVDIGHENKVEEETMTDGGEKMSNAEVVPVETAVQDSVENTTLAPVEPDIDTNELFFSPPSQAVAKFLSETASPEASDTVEKEKEQPLVKSTQPAGGLSSVNPNLTDSVPMPTALPSSLDALDPVLFQAVVAQLLQAYPELVGNQEMLTNVAIQQTSLLQYYIKSGQAGSPDLAGGMPGVNSGVSMPGLGVEGHMIGGLGATPSPVIGTLGTTPSPVMGTLGTTPSPVMGTLGTSPSSVMGTLGTTPSSVMGTLGTTPSPMMGTLGSTLSPVVGGLGTTSSVMGTLGTTISSMAGSTSVTPQCSLFTSHGVASQGAVRNGFGDLINRNGSNSDNGYPHSDETKTSKAPFGIDSSTKPEATFKSTTTSRPPGLTNFCNEIEGEIQKPGNEEHNAVAGRKGSLGIPGRNNTISAIGERKIARNAIRDAVSNACGRHSEVSRQDGRPGKQGDSINPHGPKAELSYEEGLRMPWKPSATAKSPSIKSPTDYTNFLPDFADRALNMKDTSSVKSIRAGSDSTTRSLAHSSRKLGFEERKPSPCNEKEDGRIFRDFSVLRSHEGDFKVKLENVTHHTTWEGRSKQVAMPGQKHVPYNIPSRYQRQHAQPPPPKPTVTQWCTTTPRNPSPLHMETPSEDWDSEIAPYSEDRFTWRDTRKDNLNFGSRPDAGRVTQTLTSADLSKKNKEADLTNPLHSLTGGEPKTKDRNNNAGGMAEIPLPKVLKAKDGEKDEEKGVQKMTEAKEEWCEVQTKKKRHVSKEQQVVRKGLVPYTQPSGPVTVQKMSNFERLIHVLQETFPDNNRQTIIESVAKIRNERGSLSGLTMDTIKEKAKHYLQGQPTKNHIPGLWPVGKPKPNVLSLPPRTETIVSPMSLCPDEEICVICHDPLSAEPVKELDCKHVFHTQCIGHWVERERTCPTCRKHALFPEEFPRLGK